MTFKVCKKRCDQCLFTDGKIVTDKRKLSILRDCVQKDTHFLCHKSHPELGGKNDIACRGFYDAHPGVGNLRRIAERLRMVEFVDVPDVATIQRPKKTAKKTTRR